MTRTGGGILKSSEASIGEMAPLHRELLDSTAATAATHPPGTVSPIAADLLAWYDRHHRDLPWRTPPSALLRGARPDPYAVWLSEVMLQQTTVEAVKTYYRTFLDRWPTVQDLAAAPLEAVMRAWAGLGYYSRARNLKACADAVAALSGGFPDTEEGLRALPGIGAYTSAAIAAIAFGRPSAVVDGNVERVMTRLLAIRTPLPQAKKRVAAEVSRLVPADRPGDFAQATMDLGATICTPRRPRCLVCPLRAHCRVAEAGNPESFPVRPPKADRPARWGTAYVALRSDGAILLRTRPPRGLLGGMTEVPTTAWTAAPPAPDAPFEAAWKPAGRVTHLFTHFGLTLDVLVARTDHPAPAGCRWVEAADVPEEALPTVMKKVVEAAVPGATLKRPTRKP